MPLTIKRTCETMELRGADIHRASQDYPCDVYQCPNQQVVRGIVQSPAIKKGDYYALTSTKLKICASHIPPEDVTDA